ncbi:hypothetical protein EDB86DRAFT_3241040 [Lactarius hatsudake]|nr:hypothetical protein EDB86DRAFT_3241040 [Lactarius hatsudake]
MAATSASFCVARKRAQLFVITCDHPDQQGSLQPTLPTPDLAVPSHGLRNSSATRRRPRWPPLRSLVSHGSVRNRLRSTATTDPAGLSVYPTVPVPDCAALARSLSS